MRFDPIDVISVGCKSEVHRCIDRREVVVSSPNSSSSTADGAGVVKIVAIKMISNKELAYEEINKLLLVGHRHIVSLLDIVEGDDFVGLVMPCAQMDLRSFMGRVAYSTDVMLQIKLQTMAAVHHIHTRGILHLDIKPENICIDFADPHVHCMLLDFGSSIVAEELFQRLQQRDRGSLAATTIQTTKGYHSPELKASGILSSACDIYSAGVVFGELVESRRCGRDDGGEEGGFRQLSLDMRHENFKQRPSSKDVLMRLGDRNVRHPPMLRLLPNSAIPAWTSPIASTLIAHCTGSRGYSAANTFIVNDHQSTDLQKLVTLVRSADVSHIRDAFWLLFETSVEEADGRNQDSGALSVLSILPYFDSRIYLAKEHGFFYAKSLDILSSLPYFVLTDDMKLHLWKLSSTSHACERPVLRCLANCWSSNSMLAVWCADDRKRWGVRQEAFADFVARFADDWDVPCAEAVRRVAGMACV
jgi:serine/threonine protein kinase